MVKRFFLSFFMLTLIAFLFTPLHAQSYIGKQSLYQPSIYTKPDRSVVSIQSVEKGRNRIFWKVWADREGIRTSNGRRPVMGDQFLVAEETDTKLRIVQPGDYDFLNGIFNTEPDDFGWVEKKYVILWNTSLYSESTRFRIKLIPTYPLFPGLSSIPLYNSPDSQMPFDSLTRVIFPLYLVKEENDRYLISTREYWQNENRFLGWADKEAFSVWESRLALEPNLDSEAIKQREAVGINIFVFYTFDEAKRYKKNGFSANAIRDVRCIGKMTTPYIVRMPVLEESDDIIKTVVYIDKHTKADMLLDSLDTQKIIQSLRESGIAEEQLYALIDNEEHFLITGYAVRTIENLLGPLYKYVLFLDQPELDGIINSLNKLYIPGIPNSERREKMSNAWYDVLRTNYGVKAEDVKNKSLAELTGLITGLPSENYLLKKYKVDDLTDRTIVNDADFDQIYELIKVNRDKLIRANNNIKYYFMLNDRAYYWLPSSMFP
jgi:hypothetical protein